MFKNIYIKSYVSYREKFNTVAFVFCSELVLVFDFPAAKVLYPDFDC